MQIVDDYDLDVNLQLHGDESPELCRELNSHVETIKVIRFAEDNPLHVDKLLEEYDAVVDYLSIWRQKNGYGGTGRKINWAVVAKGKIEKPFLPRRRHQSSWYCNHKEFPVIPIFYGIDINSRFEKEPGVQGYACHSPGSSMN